MTFGPIAPLLRQKLSRLAGLVEEDFVLYCFFPRREDPRSGIADEVAKEAGKLSLGTSTPWHVDAARKVVDETLGSPHQRDRTGTPIDLSHSYVAGYGNVAPIYTCDPASRYPYQTVCHDLAVVHGNLAITGDTHVHHGAASIAPVQVL